MGAPSASRYMLAISKECQEDLRQLFENRQSYLNMVENAGEVDVGEVWRWSPQTRMYVGEQCSLISRNATGTKGYTGLSKVIEFTKRHPGLIADRPVFVNPDELFVRARLTRASWSLFKPEDATFDLETLDRLNRMVSPLSEMTGYRWDERLLVHIAEEGRAAGGKVQLPTFPSIDFGIQCFLDLFMKYAELMYGRSIQQFEGHTNPRGGLEPQTFEID